MTRWFQILVTPCLLASGLAATGCAAAPPPPPQYAYRLPDPQAEALAIEAARHHPNAQPRVRPEYPEQAPPPLPQGTALPPPAYITRRAEPNVAPAPSFMVEPQWSSGYSSYPGYTAPYGYYGPSYPRWGFGVSLGWRSRYGWGGWGAPVYDPWVGHRSLGYDRPSYHADHFHGEARSSWHSSGVSAPSHGGFRGADHGSRQPRANVRVGR